MPHIAISMYPGRSQEIKKELASNIQKYISQQLNVDEKVVTVSIQDVPRSV